MWGVRQAARRDAQLGPVRDSRRTETPNREEKMILVGGACTQEEGVHVQRERRPWPKQETG